MRTILVTVDPAFPPISGLELRAWKNAKAASELGPVLLLSIGPPGPGTPPPGITIRHLKGMDAFDVWRGDFEVRYQDDLIKHFRSAVLEFKPDIVMLESLPLTNLASVVRPYTKAVIIDLHNVESDLAAQALQSAKDPVRRSAIENPIFVLQCFSDEFITDFGNMSSSTALHGGRPSGSSHRHGVIALDDLYATKILIM
jgi:hypothetical protein